MKYKVGDKVRIKSLDWYNQNKNYRGDVELYTKMGGYNFVEQMSNYCGKIAKITGVNENYYDIDIDLEEYFWTDEMFEGKVEEHPKTKSNNTISTSVSSLPTDINIGLVPSGENRQEIVPYIGYKIVKEDCKYFLVKTTYPKTCIDCCEELGLTISMLPTAFGYKSKEIDALQKLIVCRDAYRKIAGEEMGLGKPWEPDFADSSIPHYCIFTNHLGVISKDCFYSNRCILAFPTREMRNAFFENFKELIEECKELL